MPQFHRDQQLVSSARQHLKLIQIDFNCCLFSKLRCKDESAQLQQYDRFVWCNRVYRLCSQEVVHFVLLILVSLNCGQFIPHLYSLLLRQRPFWRYYLLRERISELRSYLPCSKFCSLYFQLNQEDIDFLLSRFFHDFLVLNFPQELSNIPTTTHEHNCDLKIDL